MSIDWSQLAFGKHDWAFLLPVAIRTFAMFLIILVGLRVLGKRGVRQLSVFELYACARCGRVEELVVGENQRCPKCHHVTWARALDDARVT